MADMLLKDFKRRRDNFTHYIRSMDDLRLLKNDYRMTQKILETETKLPMRSKDELQLLRLRKIALQCKIQLLTDRELEKLLKKTV